MFRSRAAERLLLGWDAALLRAMLRRWATGPGPTSTPCAPGRLTGGLNWYRALTHDQVRDVGVVTVPTTYVWSDRDGAVGRTAAVRTGDWVTADYQLVVLRGVSHWVRGEAPDAVADAALARIAGV